MKKLPPSQKILEAYTAIADGHVKLAKDEAYVTSSNEAKVYTVKWDEETYSSNDNATYWQGYAGYPIIAVLLLQGKLSFDKTLVEKFAGVDWNELNKKFKRNYAKAADYVIAEKGLDELAVDKEVDKVYQELVGLDLTIKRGSLRPPKATK